MLGGSIALDETFHGVLLGSSIALALVIGAWRAQRRRRWWPVALTAVGGCLLLGSHALDDSLALTVAGACSLGLATLLERRSAPRPATLARLPAG
jgi:hypothetical protein